MALKTPRMQVTPEKLEVEVKDIQTGIKERERLDKKSKALDAKNALDASRQTQGPKINSGATYGATLKVIMADPRAETAYAMADVVGADSKKVEETGHGKFIQEVLEQGVNSRGRYSSKKDSIKEVSANKMLRFARAMSTIAKEQMSDEGFKEGMDPLTYVTTGQRSKSDIKDVLGHALEIAKGTEKEKDVINKINQRGLGEVLKDKIITK